MDEIERRFMDTLSEPSDPFNIQPSMCIHVEQY